MDELTIQWLHKIRTLSSSKFAQSVTLDISRQIQYLTVDIISKICLGQPFGCIENENDQYDFLETVKDATPISLYLTVFPELSALLFHLTRIPFIRHIIVPSTTDESGLGKIMGVCSSENFFLEIRPLNVESSR